MSIHFYGDPYAWMKTLKDEEKEVVVDYFDFLRLWPRRDWPKEAVGFNSGYTKGGRLHGDFFHADQGSGPDMKYFQASKSLLGGDDEGGYAKTYCSHEYVNVAFNQLIMACRKCGVDQ